MSRTFSSAAIAIFLHGMGFLGLFLEYGKQEKKLQSLQFESPNLSRESGAGAAQTSSGSKNREETLQEARSPVQSTLTGTSTGPGTESTTQNAAALAPAVTSSYFQQIRTRIEEHLRFPIALQRRGVQGVVILRFTLGPGSQVQSVSLHSPSNQPALNAAVLHAFSDAQPLPSPPLGAPPQWTIELPIEFRARN